MAVVGRVQVAVDVDAHGGLDAPQSRDDHCRHQQLQQQQDPRAQPQAEVAPGDDAKLLDELGGGGGAAALVLLRQPEVVAHAGPVHVAARAGPAVDRRPAAHALSGRHSRA